MGAYYLEGVVQHYDWGGRHFIAELVGLPGQGHPLAELWLGSHRKGMSRLPALNLSLAEYLAGQGQQWPLLLKVLDVRNSLSIQVHPDAAQARSGYRRENAMGIRLDSPGRNYQDDNPKPELMVALSPCVLLFGFSSPAQIIQRCQGWPSLSGLVSALQTTPLDEVYGHVMRLSDAAREELLAPLLQALLPRWRSGRLCGVDHLFWLARTAEEHGGEGCRDPGLLAMLMMNLMHLEPNEAVFLPPRLPHAYLHGRCVELMVNSDNVLRGGLTRKHVDVEALLAVVEVAPLRPQPVLQYESSPGVTVYPLLNQPFTLWRVSVAQSSLPALPRVAVALNLGAACVVRLDEAEFALGRGQSLLLPAGTRMGVSGEGMDLFVAW